MLNNANNRNDSSNKELLPNWVIIVSEHTAACMWPIFQVSFREDPHVFNLGLSRRTRLPPSMWFCSRECDSDGMHDTTVADLPNGNTDKYSFPHIIYIKPSSSINKIQGTVKGKFFWNINSTLNGSRHKPETSTQICQFVISWRQLNAPAGVSPNICQGATWCKGLTNTPWYRANSITFI